MVRLSQFLWRIGSVPSQFVAPGTCASVQFEVHLLSLSTIKKITRPRKRPVFFCFDDGRWLTRNGWGRSGLSSTDSVHSAAASTASRCLSVSGWCLWAACLGGYSPDQLGWFERCEPSRRHPAAVSLDQCGAATWGRPKLSSRDPGPGGQAEAAPRECKRPSSERRWEVRRPAT